MYILYEFRRKISIQILSVQSHTNLKTNKKNQY